MKLFLLGAPRGLSENRWKNDIAEAAERLGWDVTHWEANRAPADDVVAHAAGADLFLWARTHRHNPDGDVDAMLRRIEDAGTPTVGVHMDLYWGIRREAAIGQTPWWTCQHVFTADGGPRDWTGRGVNHHWLPPAMGVRFYGRATPTGRYQAKHHRVTWVGSYVPTIHGRHRADLIRWARNRYLGAFAAYGTGPRRAVWGPQLGDLYASSHVVLGDSAPAPRYWSDRLPMTLGRGGVLAYPRTEGLSEQGFDESNMILYDRFAFTELGERIDALTDAERRDLSDAALTLIGERHLWTHRLLEIERTVLG